MTIVHVHWCTNMGTSQIKTNYLNKLVLVIFMFNKLTVSASKSRTCITIQFKVFLWMNWTHHATPFQSARRSAAWLCQLHFFYWLDIVIFCYLDTPMSLGTWFTQPLGAFQTVKAGIHIFLTSSTRMTQRYTAVISNSCYWGWLSIYNMNIRQKNVVYNIWHQAHLTAHWACYLAI
jgi:hypothetical protein